MTPVRTSDLGATDGERLLRLSVRLDNIGSPATDKVGAIAHSFIGTHLLMEIADGEFVSTVDPPPDAVAAAAACAAAALVAGPRRARVAPRGCCW